MLAFKLWEIVLQILCSWIRNKQTIKRQAEIYKILFLLTGIFCFYTYQENSRLNFLRHIVIRNFQLWSNMSTSVNFLLIGHSLLLMDAIKFSRRHLWIFFFGDTNWACSKNQFFWFLGLNNVIFFSPQH